jgi:exopolyphosphatase/guanosine-5'-triphosphate,3'-diphosphate pyrophosphatase
VNPRGHHKHSEYMIRWARIPGLDDTSREMIALLARVHRKDAARAKQIINETALPKDIRAQLRRLAGLLRIADALDTEHRSRVEQIVCTRMGEALVLDLVVRDGPSRDDAKLLRKSDLLAEELGLAIKITVARPVSTPLGGEPAGGSVIALRAPTT